MTIEERVDKLELKLARARFINILLVILGIGAVLAMWFFVSRTPTVQEKVLDEVRAKLFILVDENGKVRGGFGITEDDVVLQMSDNNERVRIVLDLREGKPHLGMTDKNGLISARLWVEDEIGSRLVLYGPDNKVTWSSP